MVMAALAVPFIVWLALAGDGTIDEGAEFVSIVVATIAIAIFLVCFVPAALAMLFWGGRTGQGKGRDVLDRLLPLLTLAALAAAFLIIAWATER